MSDDFNWADDENPALAAIVARLAARPPRDDGPPVRQAPGLWYVPSADGTWLGDLTRQFPPPQLIATGWFAPSSGGPALRASLRRAGTPVLALHKFARRPPFALLADGATYADGALLRAVLQDYHTRELLGANHDALLVTTTVAAAAAWRRRGLPAAPVGDLPQQPASELRAVAALRTRVRPADPAEDVTGNLYIHPVTGASPSVATRTALLVAPAWDPRTLAMLPPDAARTAADALLASQDAAGCDYGGVALWRPDRDRLEALRAAAGDDARFRLLVHRSLDLDLAFAEFDPSARSGPAARGEPAAAASVPRRIVAGLRRRAHGAADPLEQLQYQLLADQAETYYRRAPVMATAELLAAQKALFAHIQRIQHAPRRGRRPR